MQLLEDYFMPDLINKDFDNTSFGCCWFQGPTFPFTFDFYYKSIRGAEYFHLYLWVCKDLAWTLDAVYAGWTFGILAVLWSCFLIGRAFRYKNYYEVIISSAQLLWLIANFWWMTGEVHDFAYPDQPPLYLKRQLQAGYMLIAALCWLSVYYCVIRPLKLFVPDREAQERYDDTGLAPRFPMLFKTWREYENIHMFFWIGKDTAWNFLNKPMWIIFVIPTLTVALDFVLVTLFSKGLFIDHMHYVAQLLWVSANILWAFGEIYYPGNDYPYAPGSTNSNAYVTLRWYSSWSLIIATLVLAFMFLVWLPLTAMGRLSGTSESSGGSRIHSHDQLQLGGTGLSSRSGMSVHGHHHRLTEPIMSTREKNDEIENQVSLPLPLPHNSYSQVNHTNNISTKSNLWNAAVKDQQEEEKEQMLIEKVVDTTTTSTTTTTNNNNTKNRNTNDNSSIVIAASPSKDIVYEETVNIMHSSV